MCLTKKDPHSGGRANQKFSAINVALMLSLKMNFSTLRSSASKSPLNRLVYFAIIFPFFVLLHLFSISF